MHGPTAFVDDGMESFELEFASHPSFLDLFFSPLEIRLDRVKSTALVFLSKQWPVRWGRYGRVGSRWGCHPSFARHSPSPVPR
jgi:hypothetical protein